MTSSFNHHHHLFLFSLFFHLISTTFVTTPVNPKALLLPVSKDSSTLQYIVKTTQRTPSKFVPLTLALGGDLLWVDCTKGYVSSTYHPAQCNMAKCSLANANTCATCTSSQPKPGCNANTCKTSSISNPFSNTNSSYSGELATDVFRINSTDGANLGKVVTVPDFLFGCGSTSLLKGLAKGVQGIAGFGRTKISTPSQLLSTFNLPTKFAFCLTSFYTDDGVIFFGDGPYRLYPVSDVSSSLSYTPLLVNPVRPSDYYIGVTAIKINGNDIPVNKALLSLDSKGNGGTKMSTVQPYTTMETSIYKAVTTAFDNKLREDYPNAKRVNAIAPFEVCYDSNTLSYTRVGVEVPDIQLMLQRQNVVWTIYASNSMVQGLKGNPNAVCLALVDGWKNNNTAIVMGGYQLEDNLLQFDLAKSMLGFRYLVLDMTRCSNFNFTSA